MGPVINYYCVTKASDLYASRLQKLGNKLASGNNDIVWNAIVNQSNHCPKGFNPIPFKEYGDHPSTRHALGLNHIVKVCEGDYVVIADTDVAILQKNWDQVLIDELAHKDASLIGGTLNDNIHHRATGHPNVIFTMYKTMALKECNPDFSPVIEDGAIVIRDGKKLDTAWNVDEHFRNHRSICMDHVLPLSENSQLSFDERQKRAWLNYHKADSRPRQHMTEFHLNGRVFCTHMIGGRSTKIHRSLSGIWYERIENYLLKNYNISMDW